MGQSSRPDCRSAQSMKANGRLKISFYDPSGSGGITHYTFQLAESLAEAGCHVTLVTTEAYELKHLKRNFNINFLFKRSRVKSLMLWLLAQIPDRTSNHKLEICAPQISGQARESQSNLSAPELLKILRLRITLLKALTSVSRNRPDVIHFQWLMDPNADYCLIKLLKWFRFNIVYTAHNLLPHDQDTPKNRDFYRKIYQLADRLIVHAESNKKEMIEIFKIDPKKISVIQHGSNGLFFSHGGISRERAREHLGIPSDKRVILFFGLIKRYKGIEYLVQAFEEIRNRVEDVLLLIAGRVCEEDDQLRRDYSTSLTQLASAKDVRWVNEYISFDEVGYYFSTADVVVLPYTKSSQSGVLLSSLAAGMPFVVTYSGGLAEVVENGRSGFVVPPKDANALAKAITQLLKSPDLLAHMGKEAKLLAETTYSWKALALKTMDIYQSFAVES